MRFIAPPTRRSTADERPGGAARRGSNPRWIRHPSPRPRSRAPTFSASDCDARRAWRHQGSDPDRHGVRDALEVRVVFCPPASGTAPKPQRAGAADSGASAASAPVRSRREWIPSFENAWPNWLSTVFTVTNRSSAISRFVRPSRASSATRSSEGVRASRPKTARGGCCRDLRRPEARSAAHRARARRGRRRAGPACRRRRVAPGIGVSASSPAAALRVFGRARGRRGFAIGARHRATVARGGIRRMERLVQPDRYGPPARRLATWSSPSSTTSAARRNGCVP